MATKKEAYDPKAAQQKWLKLWEDRGYFHSEPNPSRQPFTIVIPPPNVTGALHMGHALNNTLQDVLIRWRRMQGFNALWMPGTDHAGIATQSVVERRIFAEEKKTRHDLGREELVKRIWQWKDQYEKRILDQLKQMGCSCDWERTRFTLDEVCARAVRETFFRMFRDGYIYRGKRLVNWDAHLQTSVADDETYTEDTKSGFWTFKYPVTGEPGASATGATEFIRFSTTRPETMLGDTAVCVHPGDERYKHLIGKTVTIPLNGREIPIIADGILANPELGTGAVKVTPAHDPNDYAFWQRHPEIGNPINILNPDGTLNKEGGKYAGLDRYKARDLVVKEMEEKGFFEGKEDRMVPLKYSDRSKTPIEPYLSDQWFVKMADLSERGMRNAERGMEDKTDPSSTPHSAFRIPHSKGLAQMTMDAVTGGRVKFFPERYAKSYLDWLGEKRDWCISRQLWWGHRIPVWSRLLPGMGGESDNPRAEIEPTSEPFAEIPGLPPLSFGDPEIDQNVATESIHDKERNCRLHLVCVKPGADAVERKLEAMGYVQDPDVLDTWFSSALWPHSTLGWPELTPELKYYYPTSVLVTNRDIITLWVARMVLTGLYNLNEIPFHHVYIHPKVMDAFGEGMSKSKGNGVDPLDIIDLYGADALRYGMVAIATETQDSRMPVANLCPHCGEKVPVKQEHMYMRTKKLTCPKCKKPFRPGGPWPEDDPELPTARQASDRFEVGRNFANKLWNAARFVLGGLEGYTPAAVKLDELPTEDQWIVSRLATTAKEVTGWEAYRFAEVARLVYDFTWSEFCDWYIEMSKGRLQDPAARPLAQRVLVGVLDGTLRLVQPVMPFLAESLWQALNETAPERGLPAPARAEESVCVAKWPEYPAEWVSGEVEARFARMQELVRSVREVRNRYQVDSQQKLTVVVKCPPAVAADFAALAPFIGPLARIGSFEAGPAVAKPKQSATIVRPDFEAYVGLAGLIDPAAELKRGEKQLADMRKQLAGLTAKLGNENYRKNAPADVVKETEDKVAEIEGQIRVLEQTLKDLQEA